MNFSSLNCFFLYILEWIFRIICYLILLIDIISPSYMLPLFQNLLSPFYNKNISNTLNFVCIIFITKQLYFWIRIIKFFILNISEKFNINP